jgi:hypothetical protein
MALRALTARDPSRDRRFDGPDRLLTQPEAAELLKVSVAYLTCIELPEGPAAGPREQRPAARALPQIRCSGLG